MSTAKSELDGNPVNQNSWVYWIPAVGKAPREFSFSLTACLLPTTICSCQ